MRSNRIRNMLFISFLASAATLAAVPVSAQSPYDGLWQVTVVTKTGSCDAQTTSTVNVADGKMLQVKIPLDLLKQMVKEKKSKKSRGMF
jgi:hypothetical protein